eukprot:Phypoly_transcript_16538.p1 GENE.Phypoly_transcript_16538~~Phypoly_transcript_16538.p1  ORF type:complete len:263 (+),score=33.12 Phypoly_transcript_16538:70-858(+)
MSLKNRVAVITGAGTGIGAGAAKLFAKEGAKVVLCARSKDKLEATLKEIHDGGGEGMIMPCDVKKEEDVQKLYKETFEKYGHIDIVVANAGINGVWAPIEDLKVEEFDETIATNLRGTFLAIKFAVPFLKRNQSSSIIVISSINGTRIFTNTGSTAYSCSKAGQVTMTKILAPELAKFKIRINVVCPGAIETNIDSATERRNLEDIRIPIEYPEGTIPLTGKTPGKSEDVAQTCLFFARDDLSGHITGTEIYIDGGESLVGK